MLVNLAIRCQKVHNWHLEKSFFYCKNCCQTSQKYFQNCTCSGIETASFSSNNIFLEIWLLMARLRYLIHKPKFFFIIVLKLPSKICLIFSTVKWPKGLDKKSRNCQIFDGSKLLRKIQKSLSAENVTLWKPIWPQGRGHVVLKRYFCHHTLL